MVFAPLGIKQT